MLRRNLQDDVLEMCDWIGMVPADYRRFESALTSDGTRLSPTVLAPVAEPSAEASSAGEEMLCLLPSPASHSTNLVPRPITNQLEALANVHLQLAERPTLLPLIGAVGGCGVTTILATLGRALGILGERVLIVDREGPSTLDLALGAKQAGSGLLHSTDHLSQFEGQVHVLRTHSDERGIQTSSTKFHRAMAELRGRVDRILVAGEILQAGIWRQPKPGLKCVCLVIMTPELRSVLSVPSILSSLGPEVDARFLLNRYDSSSPAHLEVRRRLEQKLGSQLLPFCIPESADIQEALMKGQSVLDASPQSAAAEAFFDLAEWYRGSSATESLLSGGAAQEHLAVSA